MEKAFTIPKNSDLWRICDRGESIVRTWSSQMSTDYMVVLGTCILAHQTRNFNPKKTDNPYECALIVAREKIQTEQYSYAFRTNYTEPEKFVGRDGQGDRDGRAGYRPGDSCMNNLKERVWRSGGEERAVVEGPKPKIDRPFDQRLVARDLSMSSDSDSP